MFCAFPAFDKTVSRPIIPGRTGWQARLSNTNRHVPFSSRIFLMKLWRGKFYELVVPTVPLDRTGLDPLEAEISTEKRLQSCKLPVSRPLQ